MKIGDTKEVNIFSYNISVCKTIKGHVLYCIVCCTGYSKLNKIHCNPKSMHCTLLGRLKRP